MKHMNVRWVNAKFQKENYNNKFKVTALDNLLKYGQNCLNAMIVITRQCMYSLNAAHQTNVFTYLNCHAGIYPRAPAFKTNMRA